MDEHAATEGRAADARAKSGPNLRGRFTGGMLESASHILGSVSGGIFVAGLVGPYIAALSAPKGMTSQVVFGVVALALILSLSAGIGAIVLRGLAHCAPHTAVRTGRKPRRGASQ